VGPKLNRKLQIFPVFKKRTGATNTQPRRYHLDLFSAGLVHVVFRGLRPATAGSELVLWLGDVAAERFFLSVGATACGCSDPYASSKKATLEKAVLLRPSASRKHWSSQFTATVGM
jgi:hypothetical protein